MIQTYMDCVVCTYVHTKIKKLYITLPFSRPIPLELSKMSTGRDSCVFVWLNWPLVESATMHYAVPIQHTRAAMLTVSQTYCVVCPMYVHTYVRTKIKC